jgi:hypothetical protein
MSSYYPPGCVTYRGGLTDTVACSNERCPEFGIAVEIPMFWELGAYFLADEDDAFCPQCNAIRLAPEDVKKHERTCLDYDDDGIDENTGMPILRQITFHTDGCPVCEERRESVVEFDSGRRIPCEGRIPWPLEGNNAVKLVSTKFVDPWEKKPTQ